MPVAFGALVELCLGLQQGALDRGAMAFEHGRRHVAKHSTEPVDEPIHLAVERLGRRRGGLNHQRKARHFEQWKEGREDDVPDLALGAEFVEEPVARRLREQRHRRPLRKSAIAPLAVDDERMVFVPAVEPPRGARAGVQPHDAAVHDRRRPHRTEQLALQYAAERLRALFGDIPVGEGDDHSPLEEPRRVLAQIVERDRIERFEQSLLGPVRVEEQLAHPAHRTVGRAALADVSQAPGVLGLLRLEPVRRKRQRAKRGDDAREQQILLVTPAGETDGQPATMAVERVGLPGQHGGIGELVERIVRHAHEQGAQHRVPRRVAGNRGTDGEVEVGARRPELHVGVVPQIEAGPAHDALRPSPGLRCVDQFEVVGEERIRRRQRKRVVRRGIAPARHGVGRDRSQPVRSVVERVDRVRGHALRHYRHQDAVRGEEGEKAPFHFGVEVVETPGRGQHLRGRMDVQGGGERHRPGPGSRLLLKAETDPRHARELLVITRLDALRTNETEVREHRGHQVVAMSEPRFRQLDGHPERREVPVPHARPRAQPFRPALRLQRREQAAAAFVAEEVGDEVEWVRPVVRAHRGKRERERKSAEFPDRLDLEPRGQQIFRVERRVDPRRIVVAAGHRGEPRPDPALQHLERLAADHDELHQVRRVGARMKVDQIVADIGAGTVGQRLGVPRQEFRERMAGVERLTPRRETAEPVAAAARDVLRVHHLTLAPDVLGVEPGRDEELGEAVERTFEVLGVDVEEVAGVGERGGGVAGTAVLGEESTVLAGIRVLLRTEKQHVLQEVCEPRTVLRIAAAAHVDIQRGRPLVGIGVGDDERLEPVVEHECPVVPGIGGTALDLDAARGLDAARLDGGVRGTGALRRRRRHEQQRGQKSEDRRASAAPGNGHFTAGGRGRRGDSIGPPPRRDVRGGGRNRSSGPWGLRDRRAGPRLARRGIRDARRLG